MARAKRHYISGQIWHITHRCHKREFLLKFARDRQRWLQWLFKAKKRYGLVILNYAVTSNHIHLLVVDDKGRDVIPDSIKLIAGRKFRGHHTKSSSLPTAMLKSSMGAMAIWRKSIEAEEAYQLREAQSPYIDHYRAKKKEIGVENAYVWE